MNTTTNFAISRWENFEYWALISTLFGGLLLSIVSALNLCTGQCSETKSYLFFGMPFAYFGLAFFIIALLLQVYSKKYSHLRTVIGMMISGAIGAEVVFIGIQKYQIKLWCPVCLSIASIVGLTALILIFGSFIEHQQKGNVMQALKKILATIPVAVIGFVVALVAISKPDYALSAMNSMKEKIEFGNTHSPIEVYFVSDWFCPICKDLEPQISQFAPKVMNVAGFFFIDLAVHPETENYSPYNLDFLVHNKSNYLEIRKALSALAKQNKAPDDDAIRAAVLPVGAKLQELSYADIKAGLSFFDDIATKYDINGTPEIVIVNTKTNETRRLRGATEINETKIMDAIQALSK